MKKQNKMLLILGLMAFLANGDNYAAATLISKIANDLHLPITTAALSVTAYMLSFGVFTILFGPLSDRFGKAKIINTAAMGTAIFSILGATAYNLPSLVFFRAMNGMFGAGIFPITMALVGETFATEHRQKALGKVMGLAFLGGAVATAIGGAIAYLGSWRMVYLIYGVAELILAIMMLKMLERDKPITNKLDIFGSYKIALTNFKFMRLVFLLFLVGFSVFGSFTYTGILVQQITKYNAFITGLILALFGLGTVAGGKMAPKLRAQLSSKFLFLVGVLGYVSLLAFSKENHVILMMIELFGFGFAFISIHSTLVMTSQEMLPKMKGTAMSLASFNLFLGAALGTQVNGTIMKSLGITDIFNKTAYVVLILGIFAAIFINKFEDSKRELEIKKI